MSSNPERFPDPETQVFEAYFGDRFHEVDALGHVNNTVSAGRHAVCRRENDQLISR